MGEIDIRVKNFIKVDTIFAQLFSKGVFQGRIRIDPDKLKELDTVNQESVRLCRWADWGFGAFEGCTENINAV